MRKKEDKRICAKHNSLFELRKNLTNKNGARGITLIALVITIIVLLILAAVSIATLTGDNGILTKAQTAQKLTKQETAKEKIQVEVLGSLDNSGNIDLSVLNKNLENVAGITQGTPIESLPAELTVDGCKVKIDGNGKVTVEGEVAENPTDPPKETIFKNVDTTETYPDGSMPQGATVVEENGKELNDANEGIVIRDTNNNEWVWVEVPKTEMTSGLEFENETGYSEKDEANCATITADLKTYANQYTKGGATQNENWTDEWYADRSKDDIVTESTASEQEKELNNGCGLTLSKYKETYQKMIKSVYKNGGFWIGRYEAGIKGTTGIDQTAFDLARTSKENPIDITKVIVQKDAIPYSYITCNQAQVLSNAILPDSSKTSSLLFGIQWDLVCKFIEVKTHMEIADINNDSRTWGNYSNVNLPITSQNAKGYFSNSKTWNTVSGNKLSKDENNGNDTLLSTGASDNTKKLNIYDFAGNGYEWTLERATSDARYPCSFRGGVFGYNSYSLPASGRSYHHSTYADDGGTFRPTLY